MKLAIRLLMLAVAVVLAIDLLYFVRGSLEMFPIPEQHENVRIVSGTIALLLLCLEARPWTLLRSTRAREAYLNERSVP